MAKIGIIVPVYNVEHYLRKCIESVLGQTFQDFSVTLVDDGSTDHSGSICDEYAYKDTRITVIHKKNEGPSAARNCGLEENKSEYIVFVDADDHIDSRYLEILFRSVEENDADIGICCETDVWMEGDVKLFEFDYQNIISNTEIISKSEAYKRMMQPGNVSVCAWAKIYDRKLIQSIRYPVGEIYEDCKVIDQIIESSRRIVYIPYEGYYYLVRKGSITHSEISLAHIAAENNACHLLDLIKHRYPEIETVARGYYLGESIRLFGAMLDTEYESECIYLRKKILREKKGFIINPYINLEMKCSIICLCMGIFFYKIIRKIYCGIKYILS